MNAVAEVFDVVRLGDVERLRSLISAEPALAGARDDAGVSVILEARYRCRLDLLDVLLAARPRLDVFEAAAVGDVKRVAALIDAEPEIVRAWSPDGFTPLHLAAYFGQAEAVKMLLANGADVVAASRNAMSLAPLHSAAAGGHRAICELLLIHGARVDARQVSGWTPLFSAAARGDGDMVRLFLTHGADPAVRQAQGRTPLDIALEKGHRQMADLL